MPKKGQSAGGTKARRGRPPLKAGQPKRTSYNTRLREELRERLEREAGQAGRSLSEEIEFRLERSLLDEDARKAVQGAIHLAFGGPAGFDLALKFSIAVQTAETIVGAPITKNKDALQVAVLLVSQVLAKAGPKSRKGTPGELFAGSPEGLRIALERGREIMNQQFEALSKGEAA